jgi:glycosyltransferase involved in cell wall biosynthesis
VLVVPSRWEGFGLIAAEAMRVGLPVIATNVGGLPEVVEHDVTGLIVEPESAGALVEALRVMRNGRGATFGNAGRERFLAHFTLDRVHAEVSGLYQRLLARSSSEVSSLPEAHAEGPSHA